MPITPEQRQVLLDRLKLAREAKEKKKADALAQKVQAPKDIKATIKVTPTAKKEAPIKLKVPEQYEEIPFEEPLPPPVTEYLPTAPTAPTATAPKPKGAKGQVVILDENHPDIKREIEELNAKKQKVVPKAKKDAYAKIVFYKEPSRRKMDTLMKSLHEETSSEEEDEEEYVAPPPQRTQRQAVPHGARHLPQVNNDRTEFMRQLARSYYN